MKKFRVNNYPETAVDKCGIFDLNQLEISVVRPNPFPDAVL
jgi:hypothetical protein